MRLLLCFSLLLVSAITLAQTRYVTDEISVPLRKGKGTEFKIVHKGLTSDTEVTLIRFDRASGWSQVKTEDGTTGWMPARFLVKEPTAGVLLSQSQESMTTLTQKNTGINEENRLLKEQIQQLQTQLSTVTGQAKEAKATLAYNEKVHSESLQIQKHRDQLLKNSLEKDTALSQLESEVDRLRKSERNQFFLYGVLAILLGAFLNILLPRLKQQKRHSEWV